MKQDHLLVVFVVIDPDHPHTPIGGVYTTFDAASKNCPEGYAIMSVRLNENMTLGVTIN